MKQVHSPVGFSPATLILTVLMVLCAASAFAQDTEELAVYAGAVVSANPEFDSVALVEFPFSVNRDEFSFFLPDSNDANYYARVFAQVDLLDLTGYAIDSVATYFSLIAASKAEAALPDYRIFNKLALMVSPGTYAARVTVIDAVSKRQGTYHVDKIVVETNKDGRLAIGGACVAYDVRFVGEDSPDLNPRYAKNGFHVIANPVSVFAESDTVIYVYGEIYNLQFSPENATQYQLSVDILDDRDSLYQSLGSRFSRKPGKSAVIFASFDIRDFGLGVYKVQLIASDFDSKQADTTLIPFYIVSPQEVLLAAADLKKKYFEYGDLSVQEHVNMVKHLLIPEQMRVLKSLSDSGKINYLDQYWREHDVDPTTAVVENRLAMIERYEFSNQMFSTNPDRSNGWVTDRGRIYLTYGQWDERDDNQAPRVGNPYEVWYYRSIDEGKIFVFEDWTGSDDYRLVHSNVFGEVYNRDWQERIDQGFIDVPD